MLNFRRLKGQADAPVELVVAIIILVASLSIASMVMKDVMNQQCNTEMQGQIQKLQLAMQDLALQSPPSSRKLFFLVPACGENSVDLVRFVYYSRPDFCRSCPGHFAGCWKVQLATYKPDRQNPGEGTYYPLQEVCVDMAGDLELTIPQPGPDIECQPLSTNPCAEGEDCPVSKSGVIRAVYEDGNPSSPSRWQTLSTKGRKFDITLRKTTVSCKQPSLGVQCPAIEVCAEEAKNT